MGMLVPVSRIYTSFSCEWTSQYLPAIAFFARFHCVQLFVFVVLSGGLQVIVAIFHRHSNCGPFSLVAAWTGSLSLSDPCGGKGALSPEFSFCGRVIIC